LPLDFRSKLNLDSKNSEDKDQVSLSRRDSEPLARGTIMSYRTGTSALSRDLNRAAIFRLIGAAGPIARTHIAKRLGLSPATVTAVTRDLLDEGLVRVAERAPSNGGRPALLLELVGSAATAFGVKIAPDHLVGVRVNIEAEVLDRFELPFDAGAPEAIAQLRELLSRQLADSAGRPPLLGVGLGVPGVFDLRTGHLDSPLLGWHSVELARARRPGVRRKRRQHAGGGRASVRARP
jgi:DNA-binding transcriptional ArsR family regulator